MQSAACERFAPAPRPVILHSAFSWHESSAGGFVIAIAVWANADKRRILLNASRDRFFSAYLRRPCALRCSFRSTMKRRAVKRGHRIQTIGLTTAFFRATLDTLLGKNHQSYLLRPDRK